ncbi:MAG TPA: hypothetical protein VFE15_15495 [Marmoricola sp.]|jgi:hypothetical protein|nr:hypothetical protein [Marmoricola sp.]
MTRSRSGARPPKPTLFDYMRASLSIGADLGVPCVDGLPHDLVEQQGEPYMHRHFLLGEDSMTGGSSARYHQIVQSDRADMHDHPWDFMSVILSGSYVETTPDGEQEHGPGSVLIRTAEQLHRLTLPNRQPVWTLVVLGPPRRRWGYATERGWVDWRTYLDAPPSVSGALAIFED